MWSLTQEFWLGRDTFDPEFGSEIPKSFFGVWGSPEAWAACSDWDGPGWGGSADQHCGIWPKYCWQWRREGRDWADRSKQPLFVCNWQFRPRARYIFSTRPSSLKWAGQTLRAPKQEPSSDASVQRRNLWILRPQGSFLIDTSNEDIDTQKWWTLQSLHCPNCTHRHAHASHVFEWQLVQ